MNQKSDLSQFTKDDFNRLYPLELVDYDPNWIATYEREKELILSAIDRNALLRIEHFGSTSIPGIMSKPYIDILIEIPKELLFNESIINQFKPIGYTHFKVPEREGVDAYMSFGKGYHLDGTKAQIFHIHMCPSDNFMWSQLKFRDYLINNKDHAKAYEILKLELVSKYKNDRGAYVLGKTDFIKETLLLIGEK